MGDYFLKVLPCTLWVFDSAPACAPSECVLHSPLWLPLLLSSLHWDSLPPLFVFHALVRTIISRLSAQFESLPSKLKFPECVRSCDTPWAIPLTRHTLSFENRHILSPGPIRSASFHRFLQVFTPVSSHLWSAGFLKMAPGPARGHLFEQHVVKVYQHTVDFICGSTRRSLLLKLGPQIV